MNKWIKIIIALSVIGIIAAGLGYKFVYNKPHRDFEKAKPDFTLEAKELYYNFKNTRSESEQKYNGTVILISGLIKSVEISDSLVIAVFAFEEGMFGDEGIRCTMLPRYNEPVKSLKPDAEIKLKGFCSGYNETDVILEKCTLLKIRK